MQSAAFADSGVGEAIRSLQAEEFAAELPDGFGPGTLPVAGDQQPDGTVRWAGADVVFGPLVEAGNPLAERFELRTRFGRPVLGPIPSAVERVFSLIDEAGAVPKAI